MFRGPRRGRERAATLVTAKEVFSEDDEEGDATRIHETPTGRRRHRRAVIGQAPVVEGYETHDSDDAKKAVGTSDYSAEGLASLARSTEHLWKQCAGEDTFLAVDEILGSVPDTNSLRGVRSADDTRELSQLERVLEARSIVSDQRRAVRTGDNLIAPGPFDRAASDDTLDPRTGTAASGRYNDMEEEPDSDESNGFEWETELLRRAGHGASSAVASEQAQRSSVRAVLEEESRVMGGRGEIGLSVADTSVINVEARMAALAEKVSKIQGEVEAVENALRRGEVEMLDVRKAEKEASGRKEFYDNLLQFLEDVVDMLRGTASEALSKLSLETERLHVLIEERLCDVDEFGRLKVVSACTDGDGYESPELSGSRSDRLRMFGGAEDHVSPATNGGIANDDSPLSVAEESQDPFCDVVEEFKSILSIAKRFMDWKARYRSDYEAAFGDLSLGKIAGSLVLVSRRCSDISWTSMLPDSVIGPALVRARVAARVAMEIGALWEPQSNKISRKYAVITSFILANLSDHQVELMNAVSAFQTSVLNVLRWKVRTLKQVASRGASEAVWSGTAAVKCAQGTALLMRSLLGKSELNAVEDVVVHELLGNLAYGALKELRKRDTSGREFIEFAIFTIAQSCMLELDARDLKMNSEFEFPKRMHEGWTRLRQELYQARELASTDQSSFETVVNRLQFCMLRIGAV